MYRIISCSLRSGSHSRQLAEEALQRLKSHGVDVELIDLVDYPLPYADGESDFSQGPVAELKEKIGSSRGIILAVPIYNYAGNAVLKSLIELTGRDAWMERVVGFVCAAGGEHSYMSIMNIANSLMLDFRCVIVPRFVYSTGKSFHDGRLTDELVKERIDQLVESLLYLCR